MKRLAVVTVVLLLSACAHAQESIDPEQMLIKASALTKLTAAVQAFVRYENPGSGATDEELLRLSTAHDPTLLDGLAGYKLRARGERRHAIVLMCSADGKQGLLEDVGCTGRLDKHLWQSTKREPCQFTLKIEEVCRVD
jgi:hypothetical protein